MKTIKLQLCLGTLSSLIAINPVLAQAQTALAIQLYAGLSITGAVGTVYAIQAATNLANTNSWITVNFIQLPATNYLWTDTSTAAIGRRFYRAVTSAPTNLIFIPPGTFRMGSPTNESGRSPDEGPQTAVTLSKGFYMGKYLVTQGDYLAVVGSNPSGYTGNLNRPVETVNWYDASNYCALRTQQELSTNLIPAGSKYRLPTEAEWGYACRAWTSDRRLFYGDDIGYTNLTNYAWYNTNSVITQPVGQKLPNQWGLYDMIGNVSEWCQDWYNAYPGGSVTDPQGPLSGSTRVIRGNSFFDPDIHSRSSQRGNLDPNYRNDVTRGFRVVLASGQ
jgi:formylglycine-generating enzyme required for sulfatase activity